MCDTDDIRIADAYENNLKHVSLTIPKRRLVVFAGVSGSGKSSLAFDTIAVESSRQWQSNYPLFLHNKDLAALLALFRRLVDDGNTVVIVEHRLELIAQADWIIDMGPGGGSDGGEVVFTGTPRDLLACPASKTAHWLAHFSMIAQASSNSR